MSIVITVVLYASREVLLHPVLVFEIDIREIDLSNLEDFKFDKSNLNLIYQIENDK